MKNFCCLVVFSLISFIGFAQQDTEQCPFGGRENCTGYCGLFTDGNKDGYCDYSLLNLPKENKKEQSEKPPVAEPKPVGTAKDSVQNTQSISSERGYGDPTFDSLQNASPTIEEVDSDTEIEKTKAKTPYHFWILLILTLVLYEYTSLLVKYNKMKKITHRKIWNTILLITCLVSCLLGLYIVLAKMYDWSMDYMTILQLHVDFGIVMTIIAIIHIVWHWRYFRNMMKTKER